MNMMTLHFSADLKRDLMGRLTPPMTLAVTEQQRMTKLTIYC